MATTRRTTQAIFEVEHVLEDPKRRVTQAVLEVEHVLADSKRRVTQVIIEVEHAPAPPGGIQVLRCGFDREHTFGGYTSLDGDYPSHEPRAHTHEENEIVGLEHDAIKLRGHEISPAAPANWDVLGYDGADARWEPFGASSNPGATESFLRTNASGYIELVGVGIGAAAGAANRITMVDGGSIGQAAGPLVTFDDTNNHLEITRASVDIGDHLAVGAGASINAAYVAYINEESTATAGSGNSGIYVYYSANPGGISTARYHAVRAIANYSSANNLTNARALRGFFGGVQFTGTGTAAYASGVYAAIYAEGGVASTVTSAAGLTSNVYVGAGSTLNITAMKMIHVLAPVIAGTLNATTLDGLYVDSITHGTTNHAIYTNLGNVRFGDAVSIIGSGHTDVQLSVRGAASQAADLTQWQSDLGAVLAHVNPDASFHFGGAANYLLISAGGVVSMAGTAKRVLALRPAINAITQVAHAKPTEVTIGVFKGYSFPIYAADNEELFLSASVPGRWDEASDLEVHVLCVLSAAEDVGDSFQFRLGWNNVADTSDIVPATSHDVDVEQAVLVGRAAQYNVYTLTFTIDYDADGVGNEIAAHDLLGMRLRRIDAGDPDVANEIIVLDWHDHYDVDKMFAAP